MKLDFNTLSLKIKLTPEQLKEADDFVLKVLENNKKHKRRYRLDKGNVSEEEKNKWIKQGFRAEYAAAKMFDIKWNNVLYDEKEFNDRDGTRPLDIDGVEIRSISNRSHSMIIYPKDKDYHVYLLILAVNDFEYEAVGWCTGAMGRSLGVVRDARGGGQPAHYVAQKNLRKSLELLLKLKGKEHLAETIKERIKQKRISGEIK